MCHSPENRETVRKTREIGRLPRQIRRSLIISGEGVGPCAVLQKASKEVAECEPPTRKPAPTIRTIRKAKPNINGLRTLARGYEFQGALGRFISFNECRKKAFPFIPPPNRQTISKRTSWLHWARGLLVAFIDVAVFVRRAADNEITIRAEAGQRGSVRFAQ